MEDAVGPPAVVNQRSSRFGLAPPRRFVLPAVLLLLSEAPGYGYSLQKDLQEFRFGPIDRPTTYRALAQLERDGLVEAATEAAPGAGQARRVYSITPVGEQVLRLWMRVIEEERDCLSRVLRRYRTDGTPDTVLDEVDGSWVAALGSGWSPLVAPSSARRRLLSIVGTDDDDADTGFPAEMPLPDEERPLPDTGRQRFHLVPDRSVVLVEARSTVGAISFGALGLTGWIDAEIVHGSVSIDAPPSAHVEVKMDTLRSGNSVYDAELLRRIDARRHPVATVDLRDCAVSRPGERYRLQGEITFHGVTRPTRGTVHVEAAADHRLVVTGEQVLDVRDFNIVSPTVLMLRIYPDVRVHLHVEAELEDD
jgi:PadR family transcriptional regulator